MEITKIYLKKSNKEGKTKAYLTIVFDNCFAVHGARLIEGTNGLYVAMPNRKTKDGKFLDVAHPIKPELRNRINEATIKEYDNSAKS
jgi:stage V sporulation protein G